MARPPSGRNGKPTNLYLDESLRTAARAAARTRYRASLSELVTDLLKLELSRKRGIIGELETSVIASRLARSNTGAGR